MSLSAVYSKIHLPSTASGTTSADIIEPILISSPGMDFLAPDSSSFVSTSMTNHDFDSSHTASEFPCAWSPDTAPVYASLPPDSFIDSSPIGGQALPETVNVPYSTESLLDAEPSKLVERDAALTPDSMLPDNNSMNGNSSIEYLSSSHHNSQQQVIPLTIQQERPESSVQSTEILLQCHPANDVLSPYRVTSLCNSEKDEIRNTTSSVNASMNTLPMIHSQLQLQQQQDNDDTSSHSNTGQLDQIPDCEAKLFLCCIGRLLERSNEELFPIVHKLVCENWLETIPHLKSLSIDDWGHLLLPRHFVRSILKNLPNAEALINGISLGKVVGNEQRHASVKSTVAEIAAAYAKMSMSSAGASSGGSCGPGGAIEGVVKGDDMNNNSSIEVVAFITRVCHEKHYSSTETQAAIKCLYEDNWFDSILQLRGLQNNHWESLPLPQNLGRHLQQALLTVDDDDDDDDDDEDSLEHAILKAGASLGRSSEQLKDTLTTLRRNGITSLDTLRHVSDTHWTSLRLPLRLLEEIQREFNVIPSSNSLAGVGGDGQRQQDSASAHNKMELRLDQSSSFGSLNARSGNVSKGCLMPASQSPCYPIADPRIVATREQRLARLVTVEELLLEAERRAGKTESEMGPIIEKVVKQNWVDSIRVLRDMPEGEWQSIGIPKRIVEALRSCFSDPVVLRLNTVQITPPEHELFRYDVPSAVWRLEGEIPLDKLPDTIKSLLRLMETILCNPFDESKRVIRKANPSFQKRAGQYRSGITVIKSVGFEDFGDVYILFTAYVSRITEAHAALAQLAKLHRDRLAKSKIISASSSKSASLFSSLR